MAARQAVRARELVGHQPSTLVQVCVVPAHTLAGQDPACSQEGSKHSALALTVLSCSCALSSSAARRDTSSDSLLTSSLAAPATTTTTQHSPPAQH